MASHIKMKGNMQTKARGHTKVNTQQMIFELKNKVVTALNKLADRDTYQIGVDELEKTVENLAPDKLSSFLSCILDIDSEQKSAVRKECIRLMGALARFHEGLVGPFLAKMVSSIVKRLKDPDSIVREACVETMGVLAAKLSCYEDQNFGVFISLVRPLFEAIGEQNKHMQSGSALCLARVIDSTPDPPVPILQRMLARTVKLLNNPHFMAKSAVIDLNRSIIQAGGAATKNILFTAMTSFQEALKNSDWTTRKAAAVALTTIASSGGSFLGSLKVSCVRSLESCRFDKVKPVRDSILIALQYWKSVPRSDSPEPSETGSSVKESFSGAGENNELLSTSDSGWKDAASKKGVMDLARKRIPLSARKASKSYTEDPPPSKQDNWHIEIAVPKSPIVSGVQNEESEDSCITKIFGGKPNDVTSMPEVTYEYIPMDDKLDCSVTNNVNDDDDDIKSITVSSNSVPVSSMLKPVARNKQFVAGEIVAQEHLFSTKLRDRISLDSTVTVSSSQINNDCCSQIANEMASIRKQLSDIENKQSNLMDHLQAFSTGIMNSLSVLQSKVLSLEYVVDGIAQNLMPQRSYSDLSNSKFVKHNNQGILSPRLSSCTPRPSMDIRNRQSALSSSKYSGTRETRAHGRNRLHESPKQGVEIWGNPIGKIGRNPTDKDIWGSIGQGTQTRTQTRKVIASSDSSQSTRQHYVATRNGSRKLVKGVLGEDEFESEYVEVLSSGDELVIVELLDRTGPVLDSLSSHTINDLLSVMVSYLLERRFMNSILPWLHQVADLSMIHGPNYLIPSAKKRAELLSAIQEASGMDFSNLAERRSVAQLAMRLRQLWGKCS